MTYQPDRRRVSDEAGTALALVAAAALILGAVAVGRLGVYAWCLAALHGPEVRGTLLVEEEADETKGRSETDAQGSEEGGPHPPPRDTE